MREPSVLSLGHPQTAIFRAVHPATSGTRFRVALGPAFLNPAIVDVPTLGEIMDAIAAHHPELDVECDPALRECRISSVVVRDAKLPVSKGEAPSSTETAEKGPTRRPAQV